MKLGLGKEPKIPEVTDEVKDGDKAKPMVDINREDYVKQRSPSGGQSLSNGDDVAKCLQGLPIVALYDVCDKLFPDNDFLAKYSKPTKTRPKPLNVGMQRMNLGNRIRGWVEARDKFNEEQIDKGEKAKITGIEAITKACATHRKVVDEAHKAVEAEKAHQAKAK